jgi:serine/threonine protein kinase
MTGRKVLGYTLTQKLGCDGSNPYLGVADDGTPVFIRLSAEFIANATHAAAVLHFMDRYRQLRHKSLIEVLDFWIEGGAKGYLAMVTSFADGGSLGARLRRQGRINGRELVTLLTPLADATDFLHRHEILHGEITPDNLLMCGDAPQLDVPPAPSHGEFTDGISRFSGPELWHGKKCPQSDQYSLAACYVELRLGRPMFSDRVADARATLTAILEGEPDLEPLPVAEREALRKALAKDPGQRYPTCLEFIQELNQAAGKAIG